MLVDIDIIMRIFVKNLQLNVYPMYMNRRKMIITQGAHISLVETLSFLLYLSLGEEF